MSSFAFDIQRFCDLTKERASVVTRQTALNLLSGVVKRSPVDTGRFRGNWQTSIDTPPSGVLDSTDKSGSSSISAGVSALTNFEIGLPIYIANNLPYARRLEDGYSKQAPAGMVRLTVNEFRQYIAQAIQKAQESK